MIRKKGNEKKEKIDEGEILYEYLWIGQAFTVINAFFLTYLHRGLHFIIYSGYYCNFDFKLQLQPFDF